MAYSTAFKPTILVAEVIVVPKIGVMVLELGLGARHAIEAKSVKVLFRPRTGFLSDAVIVALTVPVTSVLIFYLVVEITQSFQQIVDTVA